MSRAIGETPHRLTVRRTAALVKRTETVPAAARRAFPCRPANRIRRKQVLLSRTRWFAPDSPVGVWWLAHCQGFRVEPPPETGPSGTVEDVALVRVGGRAELLLVRIGRGDASRPIAISDVVGIDPEGRVVRLRTSLRRAARRAKGGARTLGWSRELHVAG